MKIILDTNLLVVLIVGMVDRRLVGQHRRTRAFTPESFDFLLDMVLGAEQVVVTPHVLAETSNLLGQDDDPRCRALREKLREMIGMYPERHVAALELSKHADYLRLGIADCGILSAVREDAVLVTDDLPLYLTSAAQHPERTLNFTHLRLANGLF